MYLAEAPRTHLICDDDEAEPVANQQQQGPQPSRAMRNRKRRRSSRGPAPTGAFAVFHRSVTPDDIDIKKPRQLQAQESNNTTKSVDFADALTQVIPSHFCTSDQWYNRQDYSEFKVNVKKDVMHLADLVHRDSLRKLDFNKHSVVGIEKYCCSEAQQDTTRSTRVQLVKAVVEQQSLQKVLGTCDPEMIRMMSQLHTRDSSQRALERAQAFQR